MSNESVKWGSTRLSPTMKVDIGFEDVTFIRLGDKQRQMMLTWEEIVHFLLLKGVMDRAVEIAGDEDDKLKKMYLEGYQERRYQTRNQIIGG